MDFSNLSEYIQEHELRNRIGGCFSGNSSPADPRYADAGFFPVEYAELSAYQKHDKTQATLSGGKVVIPAVDLPLAEAKAEAVNRLIMKLAEKREAGAEVVINGKARKMLLNDGALALYEGVKTKKDGKSRRWILQDGYPLMIADADFAGVASQIADALDVIYADYAEKYDAVMASATVAELRAIVL